MRPTVVALTVAAALTTHTRQASAHAGPPYPIVTDRVAGPYRLSVWTDPDATDDGSRGGQFWVLMEPATDGGGVPLDTEVRVTIAPTNRPAAAQSDVAAPENGNAGRQFIALLMDHEGPFRVQILVRGSLGTAEVASEVEATYDLRPPPVMLVLYLLPFLVVGGFWLKLLLRRRAAPEQP
jgi:hypothetical protein